MTMVKRLCFAASIVLFALCLAGCRSRHIEVTVENRTGSQAQLVEVDYPSASFGVNSLAAGADYHYRIQVQGTGQLKITYTLPNEKVVQITGPALAERQEGQLAIILLPGGKAEFHPQISLQP